MGPDSLKDSAHLHLRRQSRETQQQKSSGQAAQPKDDFTEILVGSQKNAVLGVGLVQNILIGSAWRRLGNVANVMARRPQRPYHRRVYSFIGKQLHATDLQSGYETSARRTSAPKRMAARMPSRVSLG